MAKAITIKKKAIKPVVKKIEEKAEITERNEIRKMKSEDIDKLKGKLMQIRRIGASPIYVEVKKDDNIKTVITNGDIPVGDNEIKVEAYKNSTKKWQSVSLDDKAYDFDIIAITTKVSGAY